VLISTESESAICWLVRPFAILSNISFSLRETAQVKGLIELAAAELKKHLTFKAVVHHANGKLS
jgi:hypothetical protein